MCGGVGSGGGLFDAGGRIFRNQSAGGACGGRGEDFRIRISRDGAGDGGFGQVGRRKDDDWQDGGSSNLCGGDGEDLCTVIGGCGGGGDGAVVSLCHYV